MYLETINHHLPWHRVLLILLFGFLGGALLPSTNDWAYTHTLSIGFSAISIYLVAETFIKIVWALLSNVSSFHTEQNTNKTYINNRKQK
jgi:hypothetical protein